MKSENGITLTTLMVYIVAMTMVTLTITNITRYFYNNVVYTETTTQYAEEYLKFTKYISEEVNKKDNTILDSGSVNDTEGNIKQKYVIFLKTANQYTFVGNAIYKNNDKICENISDCKFIVQEDENNILEIQLKMLDGTEYNNTYKIRNY